MLYTPAIHTRIDRGVLFATLDAPPLNMIGPEIVRDLVTIVNHLEAQDPNAPDSIGVVVFDNGASDFFSAHVDMAQLAGLNEALAGLGSGTTTSGLYHRISSLPVVTIAAISGYTGGAGSEFALACDMRFAARDKARFIQMEVGVGLIPGAGAVQHLSRLMGRSRTLEAVLASEEFFADLAERYGWINRAVPDDELAGFVAALAYRIAGFPRRAVAEAKRRVDEVALTDAAAMEEDRRIFIELAQRPVTRGRLQELFAKGMQTDGSVERGFADALGNLSTT